MDINEVFKCNVTPNDDGGYDVTLAVRNGMKVVVCDNGYDEVTLKVRDVIFPKIGSRRTIGGRLVKVKDIEIDSAGHVFVVSDIGEKLPWA